MFLFDVSKTRKNRFECFCVMFVKKTRIDPNVLVPCHKQQENLEQKCLQMSCCHFCLGDSVETTQF